MVEILYAYLHLPSLCLCALGIHSTLSSYIGLSRFVLGVVQVWHTANFPIFRTLLLRLRPILPFGFYSSYAGAFSNNTRVFLTFFEKDFGLKILNEKPKVGYDLAKHPCLLTTPLNQAQLAVSVTLWNVNISPTFSTQSPCIILKTSPPSRVDVILACSLQPKTLHVTSSC